MKQLATVTYSKLAAACAASWLTTSLAAALCQGGTTEDALFFGSTDLSGVRFGHGADVDGRWLFIGSRDPVPSGRPSVTGNGFPTRGVCYVYERTPSGWSQHSVLESPSFAAIDFGEVIVADRGLLLVADSKDRWFDRRGATGSVFAYEYDGAAWSLTATLRPIGVPNIQQRYGAILDADEERVVIGSPNDVSLGWSIRNGRLHVFARTDSGLQLTHDILPPDRVGPGTDNWRIPMAAAVSISGTTIAYSGNRRVRTLELVNDKWVPSGIITEAGAPFFDFAQEVEIDGDTIAVGRPPSGFASVPGEVLIYERPAAGSSEWPLAQFVRAAPSTGGGAFDAFGTSVALDGDTLVVGADGALNDAGVQTGQAYVFERGTSGTWTQTARLTTTNIAGPNPGPQQGFGDFVALSGGVAFAHAVFDTPPGFQERAGTGAVYELPLGEVVCAAAPNSVSLDGASLQITGSTDVRFGVLDFAIGDVPPNAPALLLVANEAASTPLGAGTLCLGSGLRRLPGTLATADPAGQAQASFVYATQPSFAPVAGDTLFFQTWYRDVTGTATSNLSAARAISFE